MFDRLIVSVFAVSRLSLFLLVFFALHLPARGDVTIYSEEADSARRGLLPYAGFLSSYAPLHAYLDAALLTLWHSPLVLIGLAICVECLLLPLWIRVARQFFPEQTVRVGALLYATSAISVQFVTVDGQNNVIISLLLLVALYFLSTSRDFRSGFAIGLGVVAVKFLPLLYVPIFLLASQNRRRWMLGVALPIITVYGTCLLMDLPILQPLIREGQMRSPGDLPYLMELLTGWSLPSAITSLILLVVLAAIFQKTLAALKGASPEQKMRIVVFGMAALTLALVLFAKKSWPAYLVLAWFPICLAMGAVSAARLATFAAFNLIAVVEHSYWATVVGQYPALHTHNQLLTGSPHAEFFLLIEILLLALYVWLLVLTLRSFHLPRAAAPPEGLRTS